MDKVSIIVPVYNGENTLARCLTSIVKQSFENIEVIVVLNGCKDNSHLIVAELAYNDERIKIFTSDKGAAKARNLGIEKSTGDYLVFVDVDDCIGQDFVMNLHTRMIVTEADLCVCGFNKVNDNQVFESIIPEEFLGRVSATPDTLVNLYVKDLLNPLWNKMYRKALIDFKMKEDYVIGEDLDFNIMYLKNNPVITSCSEAIYNYYLTEDNTYKNYHTGRFETLRQLQIDLIELIQKIRGNTMDIYEKFSREMFYCMRESLAIGDKECFTEIINDPFVKEVFSHKESLNPNMKVVAKMIEVGGVYPLTLYTRIYNTAYNIMRKLKR